MHCTATVIDAGFSLYLSPTQPIQYTVHLLELYRQTQIAAFLFDMMTALLSEKGPRQRFTVGLHGTLVDTDFES